MDWLVAPTTTHPSAYLYLGRRDLAYHKLLDAQIAAPVPLRSFFPTAAQSRPQVFKVPQAALGRGRRIDPIS